MKMMIDRDDDDDKHDDDDDDDDIDWLMLWLRIRLQGWDGCDGYGVDADDNDVQKNGDEDVDDDRDQSVPCSREGTRARGTCFLRWYSCVREYFIQYVCLVGFY